MSEELKFDYLKNEMSFGGKKKHSSLFHKCSLLDIKKQTSKNVADTTFKIHFQIRSVIYFESMK